MALQCPHCTAMIEGEGGKLPPWCPKCGKDFPKPVAVGGQPAGTPTADPTDLAARPPAALSAVYGIICPHCATPLGTNMERLPPWCPKCGNNLPADLQSGGPSAPAPVTADAVTPVTSTLAPAPLPPVETPRQQPAAKSGSFTPLQLNSYIMGFFLIGWNFLAVMTSGPESAATILRKAENLPKMVNYLQQAGVYLGIGYFFISATQRKDADLGNQLARVGAYAAILLGLGFLGVFVDLFLNAEAGLPRAYFNRHFNLFAALLDGAGVLYYLHQRRT